MVNFTKRASVLTLRFSLCCGPATISTSSTTSQPSSREDGDCSLHTATCSRRTARAAGEGASAAAQQDASVMEISTAQGQGSRTVSARDRDLLQVLDIALLTAHNHHLRVESRGHPAPFVVGLDVRHWEPWFLGCAFICGAAEQRPPVPHRQHDGPPAGVDTATATTQPAVCLCQCVCVRVCKFISRSRPIKIDPASLSCTVGEGITENGGVH